MAATRTAPVDERMAQSFMKALLEDLRALAFMLENDRVGSNVTRIGAEQEGARRLASRRRRAIVYIRLLPHPPRILTAEQT